MIITTLTASLASYNQKMTDCYISITGVTVPNVLLVLRKFSHFCEHDLILSSRKSLLQISIYKKYCVWHMKRPFTHLLKLRNITMNSSKVEVIKREMGLLLAGSC